MEGFGVHTFRLVNAAGATVLVKFHWKPVAGVHSLVWEEAQIAAGVDPDFHRRDLADGDRGRRLPASGSSACRSCRTPTDETFEGIDLLDPTKIVPEELAPVQPVGTLTLNRNPTNYFAETEQVAFHTGHLVPGIEVDQRPADAGPAVLLPRHPAHPARRAELHPAADQPAARAGQRQCSATACTRPRCTPASRPTARTASTAACPFPADADDGGYVQTPRPVDGAKVRASPASFDDHFTQATMFYRSLTPVEQAAHRRGVHLRARQVLRAGDQGARARRPRRRRRRPVRAGRRRARPARAGGEPAAEVAGLAGPVADRADARPDRRPDGRRRRRTPGADLAGIATLRKALATPRARCCA